MCGRYYFDPERDDPLTYRLNQALKEVDPDYRGGEIFPGTMIPALFPTDVKQFQLALFYWGFPVHFAKRNLINARSETVMEKQTFQEPFETARIVVPAHGYYEWDANKQRHMFVLPETELFFLAAIARKYEDRRELVLLTREALGEASAVHHRMPLCLQESEIKPWLQEFDWAMEYIKQTPSLLPENVEIDKNGVSSHNPLR